MGLIRATSSPTPQSRPEQTWTKLAVDEGLTTPQEVELTLKCEAPYHWIEEGTDEDFLRNILESDLPDCMFAAFGTAFWSGTVVRTRMFQAEENPCAEVALMGTYAVGNNLMIDGQLRGRADGILVHEPVTAHTALIAMLLARPELKLCQKSLTLG